MTSSTRTSLLFIIVPGLLLLSSCGATKIDLTKFKDCAALSSYEGKRIVLEGYFSAKPTSELVDCGLTDSVQICTVAFSLQPGTWTEVNLDLKVGNAPNSLKDLPFGDMRNLDSENRRKVTAGLKFVTHDGQVIGTGDRARITGTLFPQVCQLKVDKIEKL